MTRPPGAARGGERSGYRAHEGVLLLANIIAVPVGLLAGILQATFFEWVYHRYWLHRPWLPPQMFTAHTLVHHQLCKHDDTFQVTEHEQEEALTFQWWGGPMLVGLNLLPWLGLWALGAWQGISLPYGAFIITVGATILVYYAAYEGFHFLMHKPSVHWVESSGYFKFLERHHRLHHVHMGTNFNVVFPLADWCLGTLILRDPEPKKSTGQAAREVARRHSIFGRRLRETEAHARETVPRQDD